MRWNQNSTQLQVAPIVLVLMDLVRKGLVHKGFVRRGCSRNQVAGSAPQRPIGYHIDQQVVDNSVEDYPAVVGNSDKGCKDSVPGAAGIRTEPVKQAALDIHQNAWAGIDTRSNMEAGPEARQSTEAGIGTRLSTKVGIGTRPSKEVGTGTHLNTGVGIDTHLDMDAGIGTHLKEEVGIDTRLHSEPSRQRVVLVELGVASFVQKIDLAG